MRAAFLAILVLLVSFTLGCGSTNPRVRREVALLRAEIVDLENQYYTLKSMYRDETGREPDFSSFGMPSGGSRERGRRDNAGSVRACAQCGRVHDPQVEYDHPLTIDNSGSVEREPVPGETKPGTLRPGESEYQQLEEPVIEFGPEEVPLPGDGQTGGFRQPAAQASLDRPASGSNSNARLQAGVAAGQLVDFEIMPEQTRGFDEDGMAGDEGVTVRWAPDFGGPTEGSLGEVTFSVIDPEQPRNTQRLGLWKYSPAEANRLLKSSAGQSVVEARLPWQTGPAQHENLLLFVRVRTLDGRTLERSSSLLINTGRSASGSGLEQKLDGVADPAIDSGRQTDGSAPQWRPIR